MRLVIALVVVQPDFAGTAVAAAGAFFAEMILATVLGARDTDLRGFFFADATRKCHSRHFPVFFLIGVAACPEMASRQRWASRSITLNSSSLIAARSTRYWRSCWRLTLFSDITPRSRSASAGFWYLRTPSIRDVNTTSRFCSRKYVSRAALSRAGSCNRLSEESFTDAACACAELHCWR